MENLKAATDLTEERNRTQAKLDIINRKLKPLLMARDALWRKLDKLTEYENADSDYSK